MNKAPEREAGNPRNQHQRQHITIIKLIEQRNALGQETRREPSLAKACK